MLSSARPRHAARLAALGPGVALAVTIPFAVPAAAATETGPPPRFPVAEVLDGEKALASAKEVTGLCGQPSACGFRIIGPPREFVSGVMSVGNAAINCTDDNLTIARTVTFVTTSTDNIGGAISGRAAIEGGVDTTVTVSGSASATPGMVNSVTNFGPNKDKGPFTEDQIKNTAEATGTVAGSNALHLGVKATFESAFQASYAKQWQAVTTETTKVDFEVSPGDELQFGVVNAMSRVSGQLAVNGSGKLIKNVTVDGPSTVNVSSVVAQTFSVPDKCLSLRPPGRSLNPGLTEVPEGLSESTRRVPDAVRVLSAADRGGRR